jgi:SnoaL-like domain
MAIIMSTHIKRILIGCFIFFLTLVSTSCKQQTASRPPLSIDEVKTISSEFEKVSSAFIDAYNTHDTDLISQLLTDDIEYYEVGSSPQYTGLSQYVSLAKLFLASSPHFEGRQRSTFIGRVDGFDIWEQWNFRQSTKENPYLGYDWYQLNDGKISSMWLFWGYEVYVRDFIPNMGATFDHKPLQDYASAWSSGDPGTVSSLYSKEVVRQDTLFRENQQGSAAVKDFSVDFFNWYPGVRMELLQSFMLAESEPIKMGGVYAIHVSDQAGKPCNVNAVILLELSQDQIINEWVFYNADTLIACGWAQ